MRPVLTALALCIPAAPAVAEFRQDATLDAFRDWRGHFSLADLAVGESGDIEPSALCHLGGAIWVVRDSTVRADLPGFMTRLRATRLPGNMVSIEILDPEEPLAKDSFHLDLFIAPPATPFQYCETRELGTDELYAIRDVMGAESASALMEMFP